MLVKIQYGTLRTIDGRRLICADAIFTYFGDLYDGTYDAHVSSDMFPMSIPFKRIDNGHVQFNNNKIWPIYSTLNEHLPCNTGWFGLSRYPRLPIPPKLPMLRLPLRSSNQGVTLDQKPLLCASGLEYYLGAVTVATLAIWSYHMADSLEFSINGEYLDVDCAKYKTFPLVQELANDYGIKKGFVRFLDINGNVIPIKRQ